MPACSSQYIPFANFHVNMAFGDFFLKLIMLIMSSGRSAIGIFMYSNRSRGVSRYMFLMLAPAKRASLVLLMTLFHRILEETMLAVSVVSSNG
jgi:hypothetical protein